MTKKGADMQPGKYTVAAAILNVRDMPGGDVMAVIASGELVDVTEVKDGWGEIGASQWVMMEHLEVVHDDGE
jgi:hypothetical protein